MHSLRQTIFLPDDYDDFYLHHWTLDEVSTKKHQATTLADQDAESENDEYLEEYNEYNLPDDDKVVDDARRRLKTRVTVSAKVAKKNSSPLPTSPSKSGKSTVRGKVTRPRRTTKSENRGTTRSSVSKHTLNAKVSKGATKNTPGTIDHHETSKFLFFYSSMKKQD